MSILHSQYQSASASNSSQNISASARRFIAEAYGGGCWKCGIDSYQLAHVVERADDGFARLRSLGQLTFTDVNAKENLIPLCSGCHSGFDNFHRPAFTFFPADVRYFIDFEVLDYQQREAVAREDANGYAPSRTCPSEQHYKDYQIQQGLIPDSAGGGFYQLHILRDGWGDGTQPPPQRTWHGAPTAAFRRALEILGNTLCDAMPPEVRAELRVLQDLYMRSSPGNPRPPSPIHHPGFIMRPQPPQSTGPLATPAEFMSSAARTFPTGQGARPPFGPYRTYGRHVPVTVPQRDPSTTLLASSLNLYNKFWGPQSTSNHKAQAWLETIETPEAAEIEG